MYAKSTAPLRPAEPYLQEVGDGIHAYVQPDGGWCLNNSGVITDGHVVVVVDTAATRRRAEQLRNAVAGLTRRPVSTLVNTHHHGDHTFGNTTVAAGAPIIAHCRTAAAQQAAGFFVTGVWPEVDWGKIELTEPTVTYTERMPLPLGDREVELFHPGIAHSDNDTIVWDARSGVLFTGDLCFSGGTPYCVDGSLQGTIDALRVLLDLRPRVVVSGHGPVAGAEVLKQNIAYLLAVQQWATDGRTAGLEPLELSREIDLGEFGGLLNPERLVANLHRAYAEQHTGDPHAPIDVPTALADIIAWAGEGTPPCLA